jgi:hypothetical protein
MRFLLLLFIKGLSRVFFSFTVEWVGKRPAHPFREARIGLLLNHTSLFEPILLAVLPAGWLWDVSTRGLMPGADTTLSRPIAGRLFKFMVANPVSVTRNRDKTWRDFVSRASDDAVVVMSPEGRMKRRTGLDKHGRPMTLRGGIVDVLDCKQTGTMMLLYSGGLHHVQAPGEGFPKLFQRVKVRIEEIPIARYKKAMGHGTPEFRANVIADLEHRRDAHCAWD